MSPLYIFGELDFEETLPEVKYEIVVNWDDDTDGIVWTCTLHMGGEERDITHELTPSDYFYIDRKVNQDAQNDEY